MSGNSARFDRTDVIAIVILLIAAILRVHKYAAFSLSNDELSALVRLQAGSFPELIRQGFFVDGHPGGIQTFLYYWVKVFGDSEAMIRLPFAVMGTAAVWFTWLTAKRWVGDTNAVIVMAAVAFLQFPILYSQVARPYGSGLFFTMFTAYFWTLLFQHPRKAGIINLLLIIAYAAGNILMMYNHYFSFLMALIMGVTGVWLTSGRQRKRFLLAGLISALVFLPHVPITLNHLRIGGVGQWLGNPHWSFVFGHIFFSFNNSWMVLWVVLYAAVIGLIRLPASTEARRFRFIALTWFLMPLLIGQFYSLFVNPVLQHSVLLFSFPFLLIFLFSSGLKKDNVFFVWIGIISVTLISSTLIERRYYTQQHFGEFKDVAARMIQWDEELGAENITHTISVNNPYYIEYYYKQFNKSPRFVLYNNKPDGSDLPALKNALQKANTQFFAYSSTKPDPSETVDLIRYYYPYVKEYIDYGGLSYVSLFSGKPIDGIALFKEVKAYRNSFDSPNLQWDGSTDNVIIDSTSGNRYYQISGAHEFGPTLRIIAEEMPSIENATIRISMKIRTYTPETKSILVFSVEEPDKQPYIWLTSNVIHYVTTFEWEPVFLTVDSPVVRSGSDQIKVYLWNPGHERIDIDDILILVTERSKKEK